jgi:hypothetical protein
MLVLIFAFAGCGTTTKRVATEQLLLSDAVDKAVSQIDFSHLKDQTVFLDTKFIESVSTGSMIDSSYVTSSLRQQLTAAGALVQESIENVELVVEPRIGALGTDGHDVTYGVPQSGAISSAAAVFSSNAVPLIPEISFGHSDAQSGIAKIIVFAYQRETREPIWQSGIAKAESDSHNTWVLGAGPFQKGSIYDGYRFAGKKLSDRYQHDETPLAGSEVAYSRPYLFEDVNAASDLESGGVIEQLADEEIDSSVSQASFEEEVGTAEPVPE